MHGDFAARDPVLDVGTHPRLDPGVQRVREVHHANAHAVAVQLQRRFHRRVSAAHDEYVLVEEGERLLVVVDDPAAPILALEPEPVRLPEAPRGDDHGPGGEAVLPSVTGAGADGESVAEPLDPRHLLVLAYRDAVVGDDMPVIGEGVAPRGFRLGDREGDVPDLQPFRRGEERHVGGIVGQRLGDAPPVEDRVTQPALLHGDRHGQPARAGPDDDHVKRFRN